MIAVLNHVVIRCAACGTVVLEGDTYATVEPTGTAFCAGAACMAERSKAKKCQYGVFSDRCGAPATTKRARPVGDELWDLCPQHAAFLDRLRINIREHSELLARLRGL